MRQLVASVCGLLLILISHGSPANSTKNVIPSHDFAMMKAQNAEEAVNAIPATLALWLDPSELAELGQNYLQKRHQIDNYLSAMAPVEMMYMNLPADYPFNDENPSEWYAQPQEHSSMESPYYLQANQEDNDNTDSWYKIQIPASFPEYLQGNDGMFLGTNLNQCMSFIITAQKLPGALGNVIEAAINGSRNCIPIIRKLYECLHGNIYAAYSCLSKFQVELRRLVLTTDAVIGPLLKELWATTKQAKQELYGCLEIPPHM